MTRTTNRPADENSCQLRSRFAQRLNVPDDVRLAPSLAAALLDNCFDRPQIVSSQPTFRIRPNTSVSRDYKPLKAVRAALMVRSMSAGV